MPVAIKKYKFHIIKTEFYGFIMELKKLSINLKKIKAIVTKKALKYLPNRLTLLYSKIYYKEENYLKVRTEFFLYIYLLFIVKVGT